MQVRFIDGIHRCQNGTDVVGDLGQLRVVEIEADGPSQRENLFPGQVSHGTCSR